MNAEETSVVRKHAQQEVEKERMRCAAIVVDAEVEVSVTSIERYMFHNILIDFKKKIVKKIASGE